MIGEGRSHIRTWSKCSRTGHRAADCWSKKWSLDTGGTTGGGSKHFIGEDKSRPKMEEMRDQGWTRLPDIRPPRSSWRVTRQTEHMIGREKLNGQKEEHVWSSMHTAQLLEAQNPNHTSSLCKVMNQRGQEWNCVLSCQRYTMVPRS